MGGTPYVKVFPPLDPSTFASQLFWLGLTFGLLYVLLKRYALPRVGEMIEQRRGRIERDLNRAEEVKAEMQLMLSNYESLLGQTRTKANAVGRELRDEVAAELECNRARADAEIAQRISDAEARIAQSKAKAMASVDEIATATAGAIVARLIGRRVTKEEAERALVRRSAE